MPGRPSSPRPVIAPLEPLDERYLRSRAIAAAMTVSAVCVLDGAPLRDLSGRPDMDLVHAIFRWRLAALPNLRKRLLQPPLGVAAPSWVDDTRFDIARHVTLHGEEVAPGPDLNRLVADLQTRPVDWAHPPWNVVVVDLNDGSLALVPRVHHVIGDGSYGLIMLLTLFSEGPSDVDEPQLAPLSAPANGTLLLVEQARQWLAAQPDPRTAWQQFTRKRLSKRVRRVLGRNVRGPRDYWYLRRDPARLQPVPREITTTHVDIGALTRRAHANGGSVYHALLLAVSKGLAAASGDDSKDEITVLVPFNGRSGDDSKAGNAVRATTLKVPVRGEDAELLPEIRSRMRLAKSHLSSEALSVVRWEAMVTMLKGPARDYYLGAALVRTIAFLPAIEPSERMGVFGLTYRGTMTVSTVSQHLMGDDLQKFNARVASALGVPEDAA